MNASRAVVLAVNTIISVDAMFFVRMVLSKYGVGYLLKWIWWISLL